MTDHSTNPVSSTGHEWPCIGFYLLSTPRDRALRCTCGANTGMTSGGGGPQKSWPIRLGRFGAKSGRAVSDDVEEEALRDPEPLVFRQPIKKQFSPTDIGKW